MIIDMNNKEMKQAKEKERQKMLDEKAEYLGPLADKVVGAIEDVFGSATPTPTGNDMLDVVSLAAVFVFARQIGMNCKGRKAMKSIMKSTAWVLKNQIETYAEPFIKYDESWDDLMEGKEEESDGSNKS